MSDEKKKEEETTEAEGQLSKQLDTMLELVQKQEAQLKAYGETTEKLGKQIEAQDARIMELVAQVESEKARADEFEKKVGRGEFTGDPEAELETLGKRFVESEQYKEMVINKKVNSNLMPVKSFFESKADRAIIRKALTSDPASAGALVEPMRVAEIIKAPDRPLMLRDLMTISRTGSDAIEYVEETGFANLYTVLTATEPATETVMAVENTQGFYEGQVIDIGGEAHTIAAAGVDHDNLEITLTAGLTSEKTEGTAMTSRSFAPTAETKLKPQMNLNYDLKTAVVKTLAHWIPASRQILNDAAQLRSQIDQRLLYGLKIAEEHQILYGAGTGESIQGILTHPAIQEYLWSSGEVGDTYIDAIRKAMTLARLAEYQIEVVTLHPTDWATIELLKGSDKHYIWLKVADGVGMRMFRVPIVDTTAINVGEFMTGAITMGATVFDREDAGIRVAEQHEEFFVKNMVAILAEERLGMAIWRPEAFVHGLFDSAPT